MKKVLSLHVCATKFIGKKQLVLKITIELKKNYNLYEYVKFGAISQKFDRNFAHICD